MKKFLVLAFVLVIAGVAFADVDPAFSGSFSTYFAYELGKTTNQFSDNVTDTMKIDLNATIDEWNTLSATVGIADAMYWDDKNDDGNVDSGRFNLGFSKDYVRGDEVDNRDNYLRLSGITLTSNITGALGVTAPFAIKLKLGKFIFAKDFSVVGVAAGSSTGANGSGGTVDDYAIGVEVEILDMITIGSVFYPEVAFDKEQIETGVTLKVEGLADMIDIAAYFIESKYDGRIKETHGSDSGEDGVEDGDGTSMGVSVAVKPFDGIAFGLGFEYDFDGSNSTKEAGVAKLQFDVGFTMVENLTMGLSYSIKDFTDVGGSSKIRLAASYDVLKNLGVYVSIGVDSFGTLTGDDIKYSAGITAAIGNFDIQIGASNDMGYHTPKDYWKHAIFIKFGAAF